MNADLERWLDAVTKGLPSGMIGEIRDELLAHYEDACRDHVLDGLTEDEAHQEALRELGAVEDTADALQHVHYSDRRYLKAGVTGFICVGGYLLSVPIHRMLGGQGFNPANFLFVIYILYSLQIIFDDRAFSHRVQFYKGLIERGILVVCFTRLLGWLVFHNPMITESYTRGLWAWMPVTERFLNVISLGGLLIIAVGLIIMGEQLLDLRKTFYGLVLPLCGILAAIGFSFAVFGIASSYGRADVSLLSMQIGVSMSAIACVIWVFIFLRAGFRQQVFTA